jgi:putative spermidine/putrescine transport system permease protein
MALARTLRRGAASAALYRRGGPEGSAVLLSLPAVLLLLGAFVGPLAILLAYSVGLLGDDTPLGLSRYAEVLTDGFYLGVLGSTLRLGLLVTAATLALGYPLAWAVAQARGRRRTLLLAVVIAPLLTNILVRTLGWVVILDDNGILNAALRAISGGRVSQRFLGTDVGIVIALTHVFLPFMVLPMLTTLERIAPSLRESAAVYGAHPVVVFWRVILPLSVPGIIAGSTLVFLLATGALLTPLIVGQGRVWVLPTLIYEQIQLVHWGRAAALAVTLFGASLLAILLSQWLGQRLAGSYERGAPGGLARAWARVGGEFGVRLSAALRGAPTFARGLRLMGQGFVALVLLYLLFPLGVVVKTAFDASPVIQAGFGGFTLRWFEALFADSRYLDALLLSLRLALLTAVVDLALGIPAAHALVRGSFPGRGPLLAFLLSPLLIPHMVLAIGLVLYFQALGAGPSFVRLLVVHLVIALPYVVRILVTAFQSVDPRLEESAHTLGASRLTVLRRVTLPLVKPALFAAMLFSFLVSFDEATITVLVAGAGNVTLPVRIFSQLTQQWTAAVAALSTLWIAWTLLMLVVIERLVGLSAFGTERQT